LAGFVGALIALEMALVLKGGFQVTDAPALSEQALKFGNTRMLGIEIYTQYLYPLQVAAVLLLVAMVAAIALTLRKRKDTRAQNPGEQVRVKRADRVRLVKMDATVETPAAAKTSEGGKA
jgi:NADH-quinone oxidoreductase subunit J